MLIGYNTNVPYKGEIYHVQTEDSGLKSPVIITLLYLKGTILASKKTNYSSLVASPDYKEKVRELMKEQHKSMLRELIAGKHAAAVEAVPGLESRSPDQGPAEGSTEQQNESNSRTAKSLDDILLDYIIKRNE